MKYGLLKYSTRNIGDEIQSLAAKQFLPRVSYLFNRDSIDDTTITEETKIILNGWFTHKPENWPFKNKKINPLFISFHISNNMGSDSKKLLSDDAIRLYLEQKEIGCRDLTTLRLLEEKGVNAYFSGCLTLTLKNNSKKRSDKIYIVDIPDSVKKIIPEEIKNKAKYISHLVNEKSKNNSRYKFYLAKKTLKKYAEAKLVITSRLHCALPCLAYGTPVIFIHKDLNDPRFSGLLEYMHHYSVEDIERKQAKINWDIKNNVKDISEIKKILIKKVTDFIGSDYYSEKINLGFKKNKKMSGGISVINASKNRTENLRKSLTSWLSHKEISEIILVDWDSDIPLSESIKDFLDDDRIKVVRVENQPRWLLSKAFNLAASFVTNDKILKLDADIVLKDDFFSKHRLEEKCFYRGNHLLARNANESHLNGVLFLKTIDFYNAGGYNEIIKSYGYEDSDLYKRLRNTGKKDYDFDINTIFHIDHDDLSRIKHQKNIKSIPSEIEKNKFLTFKYRWNNITPRAYFSINKINDNLFSAKENKLLYLLPYVYITLLANTAIYFKIIKNLIYYIFGLENIKHELLDELDRRIGLFGLFINKYSPRLYYFLKKFKK